MARKIREVFNIGRLWQARRLGRPGRYGGLGRPGRYGGLGRPGRYGGLGRLGRYGGLGRLGRYGGLGRLGRYGGLGRLAGIMLAMLAFWLAPTAARAQDEAGEVRLKVTAYEGFKRFVDEYGDTVRMYYIKNITVYPPMKFKNKKEEQFYWRTVRDVKRTLPYAKLAFSTLCETYEYIQTIPDKKAREKHLKTLEKDIFEQYKPVVKKMTRSQGKVMLKLINRETDQTSFNIVKAFLGSFRAGFWQTFGRFFGINMKAGFHPDKNREDAIIDRVATLVEQGAL